MRTRERSIQQYVPAIGMIRQRDLSGSPNPALQVVHFSQADEIDRDEEVQDIVKKTQQSRDRVVVILSFDKLSRESSDALTFNLDAKREFPDAIRLDDYSERELLQLAVRAARYRSLGVEGGFEDSSLRVLVKRALRRQQPGSPHDKIQALMYELGIVLHRCDQRREPEWLDRARAHMPEAEEARKIPKSTSSKTGGLIKKKDILGPEPTDVRNESEAWKAIQQMVGLESVKKQIARLFDQAKINYRREIQGLDPIQTTLNRVFMGEPGVGKTTVAELYGQILAEIGLVSKGEVMTKNPSELISGNIGQSEANTKKNPRRRHGKGIDH